VSSRLTIRREHRHQTRGNAGAERLRPQALIPVRFRVLRGVVAVLGLVPIILGVGFREPVIPLAAYASIQAALLAAYAALLYLDDRRVKRLTPERHAEFRQVGRPEFVAAAVGLAACWYWPIAAAAAGLLALLFLTRSYLRLTQTGIPSGLVFVGSFVILIAVGTAALKLPAATHPENPISTVDAAFTITSSISQTGLVVRPTGAELLPDGTYRLDANGDVIPGFTRFGQLVILVWMQVGALGVIVFGALFAQLAGSAFGIRASQGLGDATEQGWAGQLSTQRLVTFIIIVTPLFELIGAAIIFVGLPDTWPGAPYDLDTTLDRIYHSVFLSVSSFCNAGFVTTDASLAGLRTHWVPHAVVVPLIIVGSLGFPVLDNLWRVAKARFKGIRTERGALIRLNLHTKIVLVSSLVLYILGFITIFLGEFIQTDEPLPAELLDAHFMNMNRTSGFNTIEPSEMGILAQLVLIFLMFVGGAPGSVAGGIKVIVLSVLCLAVWSVLRGRDETTAFGRAIADDVLKKSISVVVLFLIGILTVTALLVVTEAATIDPAPKVAGGALLPILFEVVSAFATCGLSLGITDDLSTTGRIAITIAMFIGRVGFLAVLASIVSLAFTTKPRAQYPHEPVTVY